MTRLLLALTLLVPGVALACDGDPNCKNCPMPTASNAAAAPAPALPDGTHGSLAVSGMKCGECADHVKTALMGVEGVRGATVDHVTGKVEVSYDDKKTNLDAMVKAINATGYQASIAQPAVPKSN